MTQRHGMTPSAATIAEIWERGLGEHQVDRALTVLAGLSGRSRAELAGLSLERRDALLFAWRARLFAGPLVASTACPACGIDVEVSVSPTELEAVQDDPVALDLGDRRVLIRFPTSFDLVAVAHSPTIDEARRTLARRCVDGELDDAALPLVEAELDQRATASAAAVEMTCPDCGHDWSSTLDIGGYLWRELEILTQQLLADVDVLARHYGWSEAEILRLSGARRSHYLGLCLTADGG